MNIIYKSFCVNHTKLILSVLLAVLLFGCQKSPINGRLDGQWEVMQVDPKASAIINQRIFYNFSLHVCQLTYYGSGGLFLSGNIKYDGDTLWIEFPKADSEKTVKTLRQYGILTNPVSFDVEFKDNHTLLLTSNESTVMLVKH